MSLTPEQRAREQIDAHLALAGWSVQDVAELNLVAGPGIAVREFPLGRGYGEADYLLYAGRKALGVIEAKKEGDPCGRGGAEREIRFRSARSRPRLMRAAPTR